MKSRFKDLRVVKLSAILLLLLVCPPQAQAEARGVPGGQVTLYVLSDQQQKRDFSTDRVVGDINQLQGVLDEISADNPYSTVIVRFGAGKHHLSNPINLGAKHKFVSLTLRGDEREQSIIQGTREIAIDKGGRSQFTGSMSVEAPQVRSYLSVPYGFGKPVRPHPFQVFVGGKRLAPQSWPLEGSATIAEVIEDGPDLIVSVASEDKRSWDTMLGATLRLNGYFVHGYAYESVPGRVIADHKVRVEKAFLKYGAKIGGVVRLENWSGSSSGWHIDEITKQLVVNFDRATTASVPISESFLQAEGVSNVTLTRLTLFGFSGDAVVVNHGSNWNLKNLHVMGVGDRAIAFAGSDSEIRGCTLEDLGEGGVSLAGGNRIDLSRGNLVLTGSTIARYDELAWSYRPGVSLEGVGNSIVGSSISDGHHSAILFKGNDHLISDNKIRRVVQTARDSGAIYSGRDWSTYGTVIENNLFEDIDNEHSSQAHSAESATKGIYLDDAVSGIIIRRNLFVNTPWAVFINGGKDNRVESNIFVGSKPPVFASGLLMYLGDRYLPPTSVPQLVLSELERDGSKLVDRHPQLWRERATRKILEPSGNIIVGNIFDNSGSVNFFRAGDRRFFLVERNLQSSRKVRLDEAAAPGELINAVWEQLCSREPECPR